MDPAPEHSHAPEHDAAHHVNTHVRGYMIVFAVLLFCTGLTVWLSFVNFGSQKANIWVAMAVATFKAGCVAAIFMHLKSEKRLVYRVLLITLAFVIGLFFLTALAFNDPIRLN
jgi:caa(3)-type oxidase subunit IV